VNGTSGNDVIAVTGGLHTVNGGNGNDIMCADSLGSTLIGGAGNDTLVGAAGNDTLKGLTGRDTLNGGGGVNRCDLDSTDASTRDCRFDFAPPTLKSFQVLTPRIDMTAGQTELRVEAQAADDISGVNEITLQFCDPKGKQDPIAPALIALTSGTAMSGVWDGTISLSPFMPAGVYTVCFVNLSDKATNTIYLTNGRGGFGSSALPSGTYAFDVVNDKNDTTAPVISGVTVSPSSVNVTNGPVTVTTDFTVIDDGSGVASPMFSLYEDAFAKEIDGQVQVARPELIASSATGAAGSGRYRATVTLPEGSAPGAWHVGISASDPLYNESDVLVPVTVIDTNPITSLPHIVSVTRTAGTDARTQTYSVHVTSARADVTGVDVHLMSQDRQQYANGYLTLTSGTSLDGVWTATIQLPPNAEAGIWTAVSVSFRDSLGHTVPTDFPVVDGGDFTVS
jgi:hypothetical protein